MVVAVVVLALQGDEEGPLRQGPAVDPHGGGLPGVPSDGGTAGRFDNIA